MNCKNCGAELPSIHPDLHKRGHRARLFCDNKGACKQAYYRKKGQRNEIDELARVRKELADLEQENSQLRQRLDVERRFLGDHQKRTFKAWLKKQPAASIGLLGQRLLQDELIAVQGSRAFYQAQLKSKGYTADEIAEFINLWKLMLLQ